MTGHMTEKREGYKKTELGWLPEDWEVVKLNDIADKNEKYSLTGGPFGSDLKSVHYTDSGVRVIQLQNIGDGEFLDDYCIYTSEKKADELSSCNIYPDDIIIAKMADPLARACKIPNFRERYLMCSDGIRLKVDQRIYNTDYILYSINSKYFRKGAEAKGSGTTRLRIGLSILRDLELIVPPLTEQQKIAGILSTVDEKIDAIDTEINATEKLKKALMRQLLTRGIGHTEFKETELGWIPVDWRITNTDEILLEKKGAIKIGPFGSQLKRDSFVENGYKVYGQENVYKNDFCFGDRYIDTSKFNELKTCQIFPGDFLISMMGTIGKCAIVPDKIENGIMDSHLLRLQINKNTYIKSMLRQLFNSDLIKSQIKKLSVGGIMDGLSSKIIKSLKIPLPSLAEQQKIADILSTVDAKLDILKEKKENYQTLKKGLMQQLLTGALRVTHVHLNAKTGS